MVTRATLADPPTVLPVRPLVVALPIALFTTTVATLLAYVGTGDASYYRLAMIASIAGVTAALIAALPGALALAARPAGMRADGLKHATAMLLTTGLFAACGTLLYRDWFGQALAGWQLDATTPLALAVAGMVALVIVGTLGWFRAQLPRDRVAAAPALFARPFSLGRPTGYATGSLARH